MLVFTCRLMEIFQHLLLTCSGRSFTEGVIVVGGVTEGVIVVGGVTEGVIVVGGASLKE